MEPQNVSSGLAHVWIQGDAVTRTVALVLLAMSLATWIIILWKYLDQRAQRQQAKACEGFWHSADFAEGLDRLGAQDGNPFRALANEGREAARHVLHKDGRPGPQLHDTLDVSDWVERCLRRSLDDATARAQSGLTVLASIASTAPFVGLFGTVWGIYHALLGIGAAGQVSIDQVAGPIGEALIMTAMGLLVAIPAVLGYNVLVRGNKGINHQLNRFAHDLHAYFVTGARVTAGGDGKVLPMKKA
ncbi:MAG: MotA/TolQ/ExbB proton channel family protein [Gammaproteobacteria bacterium]|uniref:MotA/TolQ/ExbB proton channel family protein n=1 Tax=Hydrogenophaga sp. TaxID=1904254 RepID=UPI0025C54825|nr:MotA/TolQ/ExbB proton channel family protein [Hydrogenophaga sp.]MBU4184454.1 MotA/TolQ/ExbB proton channel family protein [Gammaproteobacteria bacterium]MBU4283173.1 MotA/TolQ/ExbB proton channel family protein [Gammaproteobacteria bacterium]MBU4324096.1 MotA/TolQ/ExbB proton channel family protein [Gammaproteobacteria bacterium]MBU4505459.1 MotA/TolQ/ExbB proton channel family protein [Gammaproteobacteria bacterium]MCG2655873.1 MotA/TolQ/ExbB proton channel family protein [Hydrogenophaga 